MGLTLVTAPTASPVAASDVGGQIIDFDSSSGNVQLLNEKIAEATVFFEQRTARQLMPATWLQTFDCWDDELKIDLQPASSITTIKYYDVDGVLQTVSSSEYWFDARSRPPRIVFKPDFSWPNLELGRPAAVEVTFVAGYANAAAVPANIKMAIKQLAIFWYQHRGAVSIRDSADPTSTQPAYGELPYGVTQVMAAMDASGYT